MTSTPSTPTSSSDAEPSVFDEFGEPLDQTWDQVRTVVNECLAMNFDGCHKMYLLMDQEQVRLGREYGYREHAPDFAVLRQWYDQSCGLRFISAIRTVPEDPNAGFTRVIPQYFAPSQT